MRTKSLALALVTATCLSAQWVPTAVTRYSVPNITSSATVIDNRSQFIATADYHTCLATGSGTWSLQMQYSDGTAGGPWSNFPEGSSFITNSTVPPACQATGYHAYLRFVTTGTVSITYAGSKGYYPGETGTGGSGGGAPVNASYILQTANGSLPSAQALGALNTGILKSTNVTGVLSIAIGSDLPTGIPNANIAGLAPSATTDTTNATNITSGTLPTAQTPALTGDVTKPAGSSVTTLATVNGNVGTCGDASHVPQVTLNAKGLATACTPLAVSGSTGSSTNGQTLYNSSSSIAGYTPSGDVTVVPATGVVTLATVNAGPGSCGDSTHVCQVTTNGKGLVTSQSSVALGSGASPYGPITVTAQTTLTVTAVTHGQGTTPQAACFDSATPANLVICQWSANLATGQVVFTWDPAFTGKIMIWAGAGAGQYQLVGYNGTSQTARGRLNLIAGTNIAITPADNSGTNSTDITIAATGGGSGTVTNTGTLTNNQLIGGNAGVDVKAVNLAGDVSTAGGLATTLATVNANVGACGDATHTCRVTLDGKGRATAASQIVITAGTGTVTNTGALTADLPVFGNGTVDLKVGTKAGNTNKAQMFAGSAPTATDCAQFDASGNIGTAGLPCGSGSTNATQLQARALASTAPADTNVICWDAGGSTWKPCTAGGGGGASTPSALGCSVTRSSSTRVTIFSDATATTPCVIALGNTTYSFTSVITVDLSAGAGTGKGWIYMTSAGILVGHNLVNADVTCSGCTKVPSITSFPANSATRLYTWTATSDTWDAAGGADFRAFIGSNQQISVSTGITGDGDATPLAIDAAVVTTFQSAPANASVACTVGQIATDTSFAYFCVALNTWKRVAIATF